MLTPNNLLIPKNGLENSITELNSEKSEKVINKPSSPRHFFQKLYGHLDNTKSTESISSQQFSELSCSSSPELLCDDRYVA